MKKTNILMLLTLICVLITIWNSILILYTLDRVALAEYKARRAHQAAADVKEKLVFDQLPKGYIECIFNKRSLH